MTRTDRTGHAAYKQSFISYSPFVVLVWWGCFVFYPEVRRRQLVILPLEA